ncbi:MAG: hypothetical protein H0X42_09580 [Solirubrobacterales bacterium]|nr:hypothetical protein [Solirubrobacterales bacterium]
MSSARRKLTAAGAMAALLVLIGTLLLTGIASGAEKPVVVRAGNLELTFNGGFTPKAVSKTTLTPISLNVSGKIATVDGTHPPALKEFFLETDKNGSVQVKGYPTCKSGQLQSQDTSHAEAICKSALIGTGTTDVSIEFPEQSPIPVKSKLLVFNGGEKAGVITFYIHAYITVPTPAAIVTTVKIKKIHNGRFGTEAIASIPKIAGGSGSVTAFSLAINKKYSYKGKKVSILSLKCPDGKIQAHGKAVFSDGTSAQAEVIRTCTGKG